MGSEEADDLLLDQTGGGGGTEAGIKGDPPGPGDEAGGQTDSDVDLDQRGFPILPGALPFPPSPGQAREGGRYGGAGAGEGGEKVEGHKYGG